jgi:hypothetical protein
MADNKSRIPTFKKKSKMRRYDVVYDDDVEQMRAGFFDKSLYKTKFNVGSGDFYWKVEPGYEHRMDLISNRFYGSAKYDWILEDINDIQDPIKDVVVGLKLKILSQSKIITIY